MFFYFLALYSTRAIWSSSQYWWQLDLTHVKYTFTYFTRSDIYDTTKMLVIYFILLFTAFFHFKAISAASPTTIDGTTVAYKISSAFKPLRKLPSAPPLPTHSHIQPQDPLASLPTQPLATWLISMLSIDSQFGPISSSLIYWFVSRRKFLWNKFSLYVGVYGSSLSGGTEQVLLKKMTWPVRGDWGLSDTLVRFWFLYRFLLWDTSYYMAMCRRALATVKLLVFNKNSVRPSEMTKWVGPRQIPSPGHSIKTKDEVHSYIFRRIYRESSNRIVQKTYIQFYDSI